MNPINIIVTCCHCGRVRNADDWVYQKKEPEGLLFYSHGYCPPCLKDALAEVALAEACLSAWSDLSPRGMTLQ